jgi:hypothetical protein
MPFCLDTKRKKTGAGGVEAVPSETDVESLLIHEPPFAHSLSYNMQVPSENGF